MTTHELSFWYRNLLIVLAKEIVEMGGEIKDIRRDIKDETNSVRKNGMEAKANARQRQRARLNQILSRNPGPMRHFFRTTNAEKIAAFEIVLH